ncbi:MAG: enoyl-CoA hydratase/isomerase family protein [Acidimicrobiales bacterium]
MSASELVDLVMAPSARAGLADEPGAPLVVDLGPPVRIDTETQTALATLPRVVVGVAGTGVDPPGAALVDVVATASSLDLVLAGVAAHPLAATALAMLLRTGAGRSVTEGLLAESATYSMLQGGPEFAAWRTARPVRHRSEERSAAVRLVRRGPVLEIVLARPQVHNAFNRAVRDGVVAALLAAADDPSVRSIALRGDGPSFCSGGDLDEFGSRPDPATAHLVRMARSPAALVHALSDRVTVHVHGACRGSGVELPAFAHRVVAAPGTTFGLPEIGLGLIPGAGGTVSLPRRIGRHRTAWLALTAETIDAPTARRWGLVDAVADR